MNIIQEIHNSFSIAEKQLLKQAEKVISDRNNPDIDKLAILGFRKSKNVIGLSPESIRKAVEFIELQKIYTIIAPKYKFITEEKRIEICKRYGIVMADVERFIGEIPDKNVQDIIDFKISDGKYLVNSKAITGYKSYKFSEMTNEHLYNAIGKFMYLTDPHWKSLIEPLIAEYYKRNPKDFKPLGEQSWKDKDTYFYIRGSRVDVSIDKIRNYSSSTNPEFYIVSNIEQLDTTKAVVDENMYLSTELWSQQENMRLLQEQDPIVLAKVKGGYLVVTAWGNEASDNEVINPVYN